MTVDTPLAPQTHTPAPAHTAPALAPVPERSHAPVHSLASSALAAPLPPVAAPVDQPAAPVRPAATAQRPAAARPTTLPRLVRATAPATGFPVEALLQPANGPASILDVDPRLLVVRRTAPASTAPRRTLAAPVDERREHRSMLRRRVLTAVGSASAVVASAVSVGLALA